MKHTMKTAAFSLLLGTCCLSKPAFCAIPGVQKQVCFAGIEDYSKDFYKIAIIRPDSEIRSEDIAKFIPTNMTPTSDASHVAIRILDHSLQNILKDPSIRNSRLGRAAAAVESAVDTDLSFGGQEKDDVKHNLRLKIAALETRAQLSYSGYVNANVSYEIANEKTSLEFSEDLSTSTTVVFNHSIDRDGITDQVNLRWNF